MGLNIGFAVTGSFCTFSRVLAQLPTFMGAGFDVTPIMSEMSYSTDTRFGAAQGFIDRMETITNKKVLHTISETEPLGPRALVDLLIIAPCTGNTLGKLANGVTDTCVTMAAKAHLRNGRPLLIAVSTNDALAASARNIGTLLNAKNVYFVPMKQDDFVKKPTSMVAEMELLLPAARAALEGRQLQPVLIGQPRENG